MARLGKQDWELVREALRYYRAACLNHLALTSEESRHYCKNTVQRLNRLLRYDDNYGLELKQHAKRNDHLGFGL